MLNMKTDMRPKQDPGQQGGTAFAPRAASSDGPYTSALSRMKRTIYVPSTLVHEHMAQLAQLPYYTSHNIQVQLVLLPHMLQISPLKPQKWR